jgi:hypothetical protein
MPAITLTLKGQDSASAVTCHLRRAVAEVAKRTVSLIKEDMQPGCPPGGGLYRRGGLRYGDIILLASDDRMSGEDEESSALLMIYSKARAGALDAKLRNYLTA